MSASESQAEEIEVLDSIYDGDDAFKKLDEKTYQYMITHPSNENKNFLLEVAWGDQYPDELPDVNLNAFFNKHIAEKVKAEIKDELLKQVRKATMLKRVTDESHSHFSTIEGCK